MTCQRTVIFILVACLLVPNTIYAVTPSNWASSKLESQLRLDLETLNRTYGASGTDRGHALLRDSNGDFVLGGWTTSFGAGGTDVWVVRTDANGNPLWNRTFGGPRDEIFSEDHHGFVSLVAPSTGGITIGCETSSFGSGAYDLWVVHTDDDGNHLWNQTYGGLGNEFGCSLKEVSSGGFILTGETFSFGAGGGDVWVVRTEVEGTRSWNRTFGGTQWDTANEVIECGNGDFAIVGTTRSFGAGKCDLWLIRTNSTGHMLWHQTYGTEEPDVGYAVVEASTGGFVIAGGTWSYGADVQDVWLIRTDENGNHLWNHTFGDTGYDRCYTVAEVSTGGFAILGGTRTLGSYVDDLLLVRTYDNGTQRWNYTLGGQSVAMGRSLSEGDAGFFICGYTENFGAGGGDFWLLWLPDEEPSSHRPLPPIPGFLLGALTLGAACVLVLSLVAYCRKRRIQ